LDLESYAKLLRNLRREVRENELHLVREGQVSDVEMVRGIASRLGLPPKLRQAARGTALVAGGVGAVGAISMIAPEASIAGGLITVLGQYWKGGVPASIGRTKWLQWAVEWDVEKQVGGGKPSGS
jgi:hypothetical protein